MSGRRKRSRVASPSPPRRSALSHFRIKYSAGHLAHDKIMRNIELYGRRVMPLVRDMLSS